MADVREKQLKILDIIKCVDGICVREGIPYFMQGGTLLGAVREKGFISWDDDADIMMYREAYERFLKCCKKELKRNGYFLKYADRVPKVCRIGEEEIHLDLFLVDALPGAAWKRKCKLLGLKLLQGMLKTNVDYSAYGLMGKIMVFLSSAPGRLMTVRFKLRLYTRLSAWGRKEHSGVCFFSNDLYRFLHLSFPEDFLRETERIEFEGILLPAPVNREEYLKLTFGEDYMTPKRDHYYAGDEGN